MAQAFQASRPAPGSESEIEQEPPIEESGPSGLTVAVMAGLGILLVGGGSLIAYKVIKGRKTKAAQP